LPLDQDEGRGYLVFWGVWEKGDDACVAFDTRPKSASIKKKKKYTKYMKQQKTKRGRTERGVKKMRSAAGCKVNLQTKHSNRVSGPGCPKNRVGFEFESRG